MIGFGSLFLVAYLTRRYIVHLYYLVVLLLGLLLVVLRSYHSYFHIPPRHVL